MYFINSKHLSLTLGNMPRFIGPAPNIGGGEGTSVVEALLQYSNSLIQMIRVFNCKS